MFTFSYSTRWQTGKLAFAIAGINNPQFQRKPGRYRVVTVGLTTQPVTTMGGVRILARHLPV